MSNIKLAAQEGEGAESAPNLNHHIERYSEYNSALRTWFLWFGVAAPVFVASVSDVFNKVHGAGQLGPVIAWFATGVLLQILLMAFNKHLQLGIIVGEQTNNKTKIYHFCCKYSEKSWIDFIVDISTIVAFSSATYLIVDAWLFE